MTQAKWKFHVWFSDAVVTPYGVIPMVLGSLGVLQMVSSG